MSPATAWSTTSPSAHFQAERQGQWSKGKSGDHFGPTGPWLVTRDEVADPQKLKMWLKVNGATRQDGSTATMVYGVKFLVAYLSQFMSLNPGDIVSTGTPPGVGHGHEAADVPQGRRRDRARHRGPRPAAPGLHRRSGIARMLPLLDTHQHLIYPDPLDYGWTDGLPALAGRAFTVEDYQELTRGLGVARHDLHGGRGRPRRPPRRDRDDRQARRASREAASSGSSRRSARRTRRGSTRGSSEGRDLGVVGYRRMLHVVPDDVSRTETFRANIRKLGPLGLPFDMVPARAPARDRAGARARLPRHQAGARPLRQSRHRRRPRRRRAVARGPRGARRDAERHRQALRRLRQRRAGHGEPSRPCGPMSSR